MTIWKRNRPLVPHIDFNHQIVFQTRSETSDGTGSGGTVTWADTLTTWSAIWPVKSSEAIEAMRTKMGVTHRIRCRYSSSVVPTMRIKFGSRYFDIKGIRNLDERNIELEILAEEKV